jgi:lactate dehydrogenase-like 2-hydroxyacid dehydrogenase
MSRSVLMMFDLPVLESALQREYLVYRKSAQADLTEFLIQNGGAIEGVVSLGSIIISPDHLDLMPNLKVIALFSAGFEAVDLDACRSRKIAVTTCSGANAGDVADMAFGLLLSVGRNIVYGDRQVRAGQWSREQRMVGTIRDGVFGSTLGILGLGAIGLEIAKRASGFDMPVIYHNRSPRPDVPYRYIANVWALAKEADHLIVACPLNDETKSKVNREVLRALGPKGILVNIARGGVIDEPALIESLQADEILGAGLDVFVDEPSAPEALRALDNVVMTPHHAGYTRRVFRVMGELVADNLQRVFAGAEPVNRIV